MVRSTSELPAIAITAATSAAPWPLPGVALATDAAPRPLGTLAYLRVVTWVPVYGADRPLATAWAALPLRVFIVSRVISYVIEPKGGGTSYTKGISHLYPFTHLNIYQYSITTKFMQVPCQIKSVVDFDLIKFRSISCTLMYNFTLSILYSLTD